VSRLRRWQAKVFEQLRDLGRREPARLVAARGEVAENEHPFQITREPLKREREAALYELLLARESLYQGDEVLFASSLQLHLAPRAGPAEAELVFQIGQSGREVPIQLPIRVGHRSDLLGRCPLLVPSARLASSRDQKSYLLDGGLLRGGELAGGDAQGERLPFEVVDLVDRLHTQTKLCRDFGDRLFGN
jgi:hypothetical protein